ncbi:MAG: ABC transporter substrate-binding protein [Nitrospinae bacterium]|nr:ABC transporter substrate-binding protein [Nitrospinota bacterium]
MKRSGVIGTVSGCLAAAAVFLMPGPGVFAAEPVKVGIVLPLTGSEANFGEIEKQSFEMAVEEINAKGGVKGAPIKLIIEDDQSKPDVGRNAIEKLIQQDKVALVGGGYSSSVTAAMAGVAINKSFPLLINTGSADNITEPSSYTPSGQMATKKKKQMDEEKDPARKAELKAEMDALKAKSGEEVASIMPRYSIFRLNPPASEYADGIEGFLKEVVKPATAVILYENSLFGTSSASNVEERFKRLGIKILIKEGYDKTTLDFKPILSRVKQENPDIIYMVSYSNDAALLMNHSMELKLNPKLFVGGGAGFTLPEFYESAGKAANKVISATLWHQSLPHPGARQYFDNFVKRYKKDTEYHGAEAYAAMYVIADALKRAKSLEPVDVKKALAATDMMTVFGPVKFVSEGKKVNQNKMDTYVVQWLGGKLEVIWPKKSATAKYAYPVDWAKERK